MLVHCNPRAGSRLSSTPIGSSCYGSGLARAARVDMTSGPCRQRTRWSECRRPAGRCANARYRDMRFLVVRVSRASSSERRGSASRGPVSRSRMASIGPSTFRLRRQPMACRLQRSGIRRISSWRGRANRRSRHGWRLRGRIQRHGYGRWSGIAMSCPCMRMSMRVSRQVRPMLSWASQPCPGLPGSSDRSTSWRPGGRRR